MTRHAHNNTNVTYVDVTCLNVTTKKNYCNICEKAYTHKSRLERDLKDINEKETSVKHKL